MGRLLSIFAAVLILAAAGSAEAACAVEGTWKNKLGSVLTIGKAGADGTFDGTLVNKAEGYSCQNRPFPVRGLCAADQISFDVVWKDAEEDCRSLTSWTGFVMGNAIITRWTLVYVGKMDKQAITGGSDVYGRTVK